MRKQQTKQGYDTSAITEGKEAHDTSTPAASRRPGAGEFGVNNRR